MIVTLVSQCEKKARLNTRRILDAFANRIGVATWQTVITEEGLNSLRMQLRQIATKNTAVACHILRSRKQSELLWIVGNRQKFNDQGYVPVNTTSQNILHSAWENDWIYLPVIKSLTAISALFHDLGKASEAFQKKLKQNQKIADSYRHEWLSIVLLSRWISQYPDDRSWLQAFAKEEALESFITDTKIEKFEVDFRRMPPSAQLVCWLIVSHHRLPDLQNSDYLSLESNRYAPTMEQVLENISAEWGYSNLFEDSDIEGCKTILLSDLKEATSWLSMIKKWTSKLLEVLPSLELALQDGTWRIIAMYSHLSLTLGDHYFSSLPSKKHQCKLIANTCINGKPNQCLAEHLMGVAKQAIHVAHHLSRFEDEMEFAQDLRFLAKSSPAQFKWQDKAVEIIRKHRRESCYSKDDGYFIVNMASTGKGKTIANAKIMRALSPDENSLRYVLGLGLRTLTLQTGDSYRDDLHLTEDDLAVVIGSEVVQELHNNSEKYSDQYGAESAERLLSNKLLYTPTVQYDYLDFLFQKNENKYKAFLYKPVLCCTIDHMMSATETVRGGRFILPTLRLMSSDLIIDEIDDFGPKDSLAISRLVHLAGMMGRKVMISSATIPPDLALGLFDAYQEGRRLYSSFKGKSSSCVSCMWVDEFRSAIKGLSIDENVQRSYQEAHQAFVLARSSRLTKEPIKHLAYVIDCESIKDADTSDDDKRNQYCSLIKTHIEELHRTHHQLDELTQKRVSFGLVRVANVKPCIKLSRYLLKADWGDCEPRILTYHSREILLLRSRKEAYLDRVLKRKAIDGVNSYGIYDDLVRRHLNDTEKKDVIFIVVATPVEEVGRDHDFDWAIVEPSSYRSIIQLAGRVLRHRTIDTDVNTPNIGLLQYNIRGLLGEKVAFHSPGFESSFNLLSTKNLKSLIQWNEGLSKINAIPRITKNKDFNPTERLADLEHEAIRAMLCNQSSHGASSFNGWVKEPWFLTALPQRINPFRGKNTDIQLWARATEDAIDFCEKNDRGVLVSRGDIYKIVVHQLTNVEQSRLWLQMDYRSELQKLNSGQNDEVAFLEKNASRFGEVLLIKSFFSHDDLCNVYIENLGLLCGVKIDDSEY